jgi:hypothetical protein
VTEPTGYGESGDDAKVTGNQSDVALTTDDDAQRDDAPIRPGNESD